MKRITKWLVCFLVAILLCSITVFAATESITVNSCLIESDQVSVSLDAASGISSSDDTLYLFAVPTYKDGISDETPIASVPYTGSGTYTLSAPLNDGTEGSLLYSKFYVGVNSSGKYEALTDGNYITNPEVLASSNTARTKTDSKKGIHIDFAIGTDLEDLGINYSFFNICYEDIISNSPTDISYTYNGKTYYFKSLADYDTLISNMTRNGIAVTVTLRNEYRSGYEYMVHPGVSPNNGSINYAVNSSTQEGVEALAAATHFLAQRYDGTDAKHGKVENWIFGNEVNDNRQYYYMGPTDTDTFVREYLKSYRVVYNAIKSAYSNANVYVCLEHRWNTADSTTDYAGKNFVDKFSAYAKAQGDMDWSLAYHPYSFPMSDPDILNDGAATIDENGNPTYGGEVTNSVTTPIITMKNLQVLTDYFHSTELRNPEGKVRSIILSEQGYTSTSNVTGVNQARQAANIALAYYIAEMNDDVDAFILRASTDENEGSDYYKFGLRYTGTGDKPGDPKFSYEVYKYLDTPASTEYTKFALPALNISKWSEAVPNWSSSVLDRKGSHVESTLYAVTGTSDSKVLVDNMLNQWEPGYNIFTIGEYDYAPSYYPKGVAVANNFAYHLAYQGVEVHLPSAQDLSGKPYLTLDVNFKPKDDSGSNDRLELKVRVHSGDDVYDAVGIVDVNKDYTVCLDLRDWDARSSIDCIEVLIREYGQKKSFDGTFTVYNTAASSSVSGQQMLESGTPVKTDLSDAYLSYQKSFNYTGSKIEPALTVKLNDSIILTPGTDYDVIYHDNVAKGTGHIVVVGIGNYTGYVTGDFTIQNDFPTVYNGVDYAPVYSYGYYKENNPVVVAEVGTDPQKLLEHFVTKGMKYALQGTGDFNVMAYAQINSDLQPHFGTDWPAYYLHYIQYGIAEGRSISGIQPPDMEMPVYPTVPTDPTDPSDPTEPTDPSNPTDPTDPEDPSKPKVTLSYSSKGYPVLKWNKIDGAKKYQVYYATEENGTYKRLTTTSKLTYTHKKAGSGKEIFYKVRVYGKTEATAGTFSDVVRGVKVLSTPKLTISTKQSLGKNTIKWGKITGATSYELQCSVNGGEFTTIATTASRSYVHTGLSNGNIYTYRLMAKSAVEDAASAWSKEKQVIYKCSKPTVTLSLDSANGKPVLTWNPVSGAKEYQVYYATSKSGKYQLMATVSDPGWMHEEAPIAKTCYYKVKAVDQNGYVSSYSSVKSITTRCDAPTGVSVTLNSKGKPVLTWEAVEGAKKYEVYYATSPDGKFKKLTTTSKLTYTHSKAKTGTTYYYMIRAYGKSTSSRGEYSVVVTF